MKTMETITSIFRLTGSLFGRESSFSGRLDQNLVESGKRVIIFEYPQVLQSADTVEEATAFLLKEKEAGRARHAAVYLHDTDLWHKLDTSSLLPNREPREVPKESPAMKAIESITTFFRSADFSLRRTSTHKGYTGRLDQSVVHSGKRVIVFEYPQVLQSADTVEEATGSFLRRHGRDIDRGRSPSACHRCGSRRWHRWLLPRALRREDHDQGDECESAQDPRKVVAAWRRLNLARPRRGGTRCDLGSRRSAAVVAELRARRQRRATHPASRFPHDGTALGAIPARSGGAAGRARNGVGRRGPGTTHKTGSGKGRQYSDRS